MGSRIQSLRIHKTNSCREIEARMPSEANVISPPLDLDEIANGRSFVWVPR